MHLVGPLQVSPEAISQLRQALTVFGEVPRSRIAEEYENADVFVLPSISEGSATVCYEALAMGLPVITTPNAGSVIRDGLDGFIVPIRDPRALADRIATLAGDRDLLDEMSHNARLSAQNYTWDCYGQRLIDAIQQPFANAA